LLEPPPSPLDLKFRLFGTPVRVSPYFWVCTVLLALGPWQGGGLDPVWILLWVLAVFASILLHEFGHVWAGRVFGARGYIVLHGLGGVAVGAARAPAAWQRILIFLAGPAIQLVLFGALYLLVRSRPELPQSLALLVFFLFWINLVWPLFNLVPVWPLDGGQVCREVCTAASPSRGLILSLYISIAAALLLTAWALVTWLLRRPIPEWIPVTGSLFTVLFFGLFAYFSFQQFQYERQRGGSWREPSDRYPWER
jgi:Zn-dependent protease